VLLGAVFKNTQTTQMTSGRPQRSADMVEDLGAQSQALSAIVDRPEQVTGPGFYEPPTFRCNS
jgi:hypothetical protein